MVDSQVALVGLLLFFHLYVPLCSLVHLKNNVMDPREPPTNPALGRSVYLDAPAPPEGPARSHLPFPSHLCLPDSPVSWGCELCLLGPAQRCEVLLLSQLPQCLVSPSCATGWWARRVSVPVLPPTLWLRHTRPGTWLSA